MTPQEWDDSPWALQQVYLNGFRQEGILKDEESSSSHTPAPVSKGQATTKKIDLTSASLDSLAGSFTVRRAG